MSTGAMKGWCASRCRGGRTIHLHGEWDGIIGDGLSGTVQSFRTHYSYRAQSSESMTDWAGRCKIKLWVGADGDFGYPWFLALSFGLRGRRAPISPFLPLASFHHAGNRHYSHWGLCIESAIRFDLTEL